jgi:hypothetical protein
MQLIRITLKRRKTTTIQLPESWQELDISQRIKLIKLLLVSDNASDAHIRFLPRVIKLPWGFQFHMFAASDVAAMGRVMKDLVLTANAKPIISEFSHKGKTYELSGDDFDYGKAIQFAITVEAYQKFQTEKTEIRLIEFCAALLREKGNNADLETGEMYEQAAELRAKHLIDMPIEYKLITLKYFEGVQILISELGDKYALWDDKKTDILADGEPQHTHINVFGWKTVYRNLAQHNLLSYDAICKRGFWEIFQILVERKVNDDHLQKRLEQNEITE